jgi:hypothetical protein
VKFPLFTLYRCVWNATFDFCGVSAMILGNCLFIPSGFQNWRVKPFTDLLDGTFDTCRGSLNDGGRGFGHPNLMCNYHKPRLVAEGACANYSNRTFLGIYLLLNLACWTDYWIGWGVAWHGLIIICGEGRQPLHRIDYDAAPSISGTGTLSLDLANS